MNFRTTLALLVLTAAGVVLYLYGLTLPASLTPGPPPPATAPGTSLTLLTDKLTPDKLTRIELTGTDRPLTLERTPGGEWSLPGKWPTRQVEVEELVTRLTTLRSRFAAEPIGGGGLDRFGLDHPALTVKVTADGQEYALAFAEKDQQGSSGRFVRPTYLRVDQQSEVVRLGPGIIASLDKPADYYQQRRLFPSERIPREAGATDKIERLLANKLTVEGPKDVSGVFTLEHKSDDWEVLTPVKDRADPDKLRTLLSSVPDLWAEQFVAGPYKSLAEYGLEPPEQTIAVTRPGGTTTLLIGKMSPTVRERKVARPTPPGMPPGLPPLTETVKEEYRYAKLRENSQIFEIKAERLKEIFVPVKELRDARLARYKTEDVRRMEIKYAGQEVLVAKEKDRWQLEKPLKADADSAKVNEVLDKLSGLQARDADVVDTADAKAHGFDDPAKVGSVRLTLEEEKGEGEKKTKATRIIVFSLGKHDADKKKLAMKVEPWSRIDLVEDSLVALAKRPALAYRGKRVLDFFAGDVDAITVERPGEKLALQSVKEGWKLTSPVQGDADAVKAGGLATTLSSLEATEFLNDGPKPEDLDAYGLGKGALKASVAFKADSKKPAQTLLVGKARTDKPTEFYAKLESGPSVFSVKKEIREGIDQASLAYRPQQLWQVLSDEVSALRIQRSGQEEYRLARKEGTWQIGGPFDAAALTALVEPMLTELTGPRVERYEAHDAKAKLADYGLDKPHGQIGLTAGGKDRILLLGKPTDKDPKNRYGKLSDGDAVFVVGDKLLTAIDRSALDLLDRKLLTVDERTIERVQIQGAGSLALQRQGEEWQVVESPAPAPFAADRATVDGLLRSWADLQALRFAAYGPKADAAKFGLDKPSSTVTLRVQPPGKDGQKPPAATHTLALGKIVEGTSGDRYARLDNGPGIAILPGFAANELTRTYLDFVNRTLAKGDASKVTGLVRQAGAQSVELRKKDDGWHLVKPQAVQADDATLDRLVDQLATLRASKVAAYPAKDLKPFGLEAPAATVTLDGPKPISVRIGKPVEGATGDDADRYGQVQGSDVVGVLPGALCRLLVADPIKYRNKAVARFDDADRVTLERGPRKATFAKIDGTWKLVEPAEAEAEQADLDDFINALARLRAEELVAEKPADLKAYGLDKPEAKWRLNLGATEKMSLLVGARDKSGRAHAQVVGKDLVFLLDPTLTGRVLGEYRKRTIWTTSPDPSQVDNLRYGYARGAFVLEKVDNTWRVAGKPEVKVSATTVSDTLAALDKLRVERFVVDKGADLKLFGLEPPELVLEVQTPAGKKELHIGRTEGESKRVYVRVPEKDRGDVFVISESDATRIVRDLNGFTEKGEKPGRLGTSVP